MPNTFLTRLLLISSFVLFGLNVQATGEPGASEFGIVSRFIDGDTVEVRFAQGDVQVRLHAIDTPDMEQQYYAEANAALVELIGDQQVSLHTATEDRGRLGAVIFVDGRDVNAAMIGTSD